MKIPANILIVDDNEDILDAARILLKQYYTTVHCETNANKISDLLSKHSYQIILLDMNFSRGVTSGEEGYYYLKKIKETTPNVVIILFTAFGSIDTAIDAIKAGASDFILKPWQNQKLLATVASALSLSKSQQEIEHLHQVQTTIEQTTAQKYQHFVATSPAMTQVFDTIKKAAKTDANILILGESGTGKELVAREIHRQSLRKNNIFLGVDMGSISESLFESELFGHKKGAFTDARNDRKGRFELAKHGSLFLDEIGNLSMQSQSKLLTAIQHKTVTPIGANHAIKIDLRLITATNMPLYEMIRNNTFRQDLLYRINTVEIHIPPLRERTQDIPLLLQHYSNYYCNKYHRPQKNINNETLNKLCNYSWPGNIRELQHLTERAVIMSNGNQLQFQLDLETQNPADQELSIDDLNIQNMEKLLVKKALKLHKGNITHAAKALGITRTSLYRKMDKFDY